VPRLLRVEGIKISASNYGRLGSASRGREGEVKESSLCLSVGALTRRTKT